MVPPLGAISGHLGLELGLELGLGLGLGWPHALGER
jgi:hypothetical protein